MDEEEANQQADEQSLAADPAAEVKRLKTEIQIYEKEADQWETKSKKILKRYKDDRGTNDNKRRFNIFWSNIQTMLPSIYGNVPEPNIERRFRDQDDVGRYASDVLERCTKYFIKEKGFNLAMKAAVRDFAIIGRGTMWVRYVPHIRDVPMPNGPEVTDSLNETPGIEALEPQVMSEVYYEEVVVDYVHWQDFGHNICRTWDEIYLNWRRVFMDRDALIARFGKEIAKEIPLDYKPKDLKDTTITTDLSKATIYEVWDKKTKKVTWLHKDFAEYLDQQDDPLGLKDFFPAPMPLLANLAGDSCIPIADYTQYQDQALELDQLTARISSLQKALKVAGVYDSSAKGLDRLLSEGVDNTLIPVDQWSVFAEKGGLQGTIAFLPIDQVAKALQTLYQVRSQTKADLYEIAGISDLQRGVSDPNETAEAQNLKGQYTSTRMGDKQRSVQDFARETVVRMAEIIAKHFTLDMIKRISGITLLTEQEKQQYQQLLQPPQPPAPMPGQMPPPGGMQPGMGPQPPMNTPPGIAPHPMMPGMPPAPPPIPPEQLDNIKEMLADPSWEQIDALLKDDAALCFHIDIETDSTIKVDQEADKASRIEFTKTVSAMVEQMNQITDPRMLALAGKFLLFTVRGFKTGRELESDLENIIREFENDAQGAQGNKKPDPKVMAIQAGSQAKQNELQMEYKLRSQELGQENQNNLAEQRQDMAQDAARNQLELRRDMAQQAADAAIERMRIASDQMTKTMSDKLSAATDILVAHINSASRIENARVTSGNDDGLQAFQFEQTRESQ